MKISEQFKTKKPLLSFEVFPPKPHTPINTIYDTIDELNKLDPDFISVTYGAGGTTKDRTVEISSYIQNRHNLSSTAHLTCLTSSKDEIDHILKDMVASNIHNVLALRGDYPKDPSVVIPENRFESSVELIKYIKEKTDLCVSAACYPEKHPDAKDLDADIDFLKRKVDAGADFLVTQMFFNNDAFYDFYDKAVQKGINVPIVTGIMPILRKSQMKAVGSLTGNAIPKNLKRLLDKYVENDEALHQAGMSFAISQIVDLLSWGVDGVHIYTMNKADTAKEIMNNISSIRDVLTNDI